MIWRTDIINYLIEKFDYESYLEIGIDSGKNFSQIEAMTKIGVDPDPEASVAVTHRMTSDAFFAQNTDTFDIIFIDGLHEAPQAYKDAIHSLAQLNEGGTIVMHDCSPPTRASQITPFPGKDILWCGDVWRAWLKLRQRADLYMEVIDTDFGVGIIRLGEQTPQPGGVEDISYSEFNADRTFLLNLKPPNHILGTWTHDARTHEKSHRLT